MADETDVENVIVGILTGALYPNGTSQPSIALACTAAGFPATLIVPVNAKVFRGWPTPQQQMDAIAGNYVNVSVASRNNAERNMTRYPIMAIQAAAPVHTLTATVDSHNRVTIGGTVSTPQNVILLIGPFNQVGYGVQPSDTLATIASGLAANVNAVFPGMASAAGSVVTLATGRSVIARISGQAATFTETKRQEKLFQICVWAPPCTDKSKDADAWRQAVVNVIDPALSSLIRITLPDNAAGHIWFHNSWSLEAAQSEGLYRRDLFYWVEYPTSILGTAFEIGAMQTQLQGAPTPDGTIVTFPASPGPANPPLNVES